MFTFPLMTITESFGDIVARMASVVRFGPTVAGSIPSNGGLSAGDLMYGGSPLTPRPSWDEAEMGTERRSMTAIHPLMAKPDPFMRQPPHIIGAAGPP